MSMTHGARPSRLIASKGRLFASALSLALAGCPGPATKGPDATPQTQAPEPLDIAESVYDGTLKNGWQESGSAPRDPSAGGPARMRFNTSGEWTLTRAGLNGHYGALLFRVKEPSGEGEFLEVRLGSSDGHVFPSIKLKPDHRTIIGDGWSQILIPMPELDPDGAPFDRVTFRPFRPFGSEWVLFDKIALAKGSLLPQTAVYAMANAKRTRARIACDAKATKISPLIYGIAVGDDAWPRLGATARRWGGNRSTRYNWETHFDNSAQDWFFENHTATPYTEFLASSAAHQALNALTIPILGWVAKDGTSYSFPVSVYGPQSKTDPWRPDAGNGQTAAGANILPGPPSRTSAEASPEWARRWVSTIRASDAKTGHRSVYEYILDNEPMLWSTTHRDVRPDPLGYDELLDRTIQYGTAIREADPDAVIAGPAEWGWSNYLFSAKDLAGSFGLHSDRRAHGDVPLVEWYLRKLREHEQKSGKRVLDVLDLHYYPQESNVYGGGGGGTDRETQLLRLRSTRSLWDETYLDESWINAAIRLLPRMREWVDANYPGRGISIGEWNFGGEKDITGALATAEALGRFAQFGVTSAFYWTAPPPGSPSTFGFLAYRNFDGKGGRFLDWYLPTTATSGVSLFVSRDAGAKHLVAVAINMSPDTPLLADIDSSSCGALASHQAYAYSRDAAAFVAEPTRAGDSLEQLLLPWSITVIDLRLRD
jgi:hypothetical protein